MARHLPEHVAQATRFAPLTDEEVKAQTDSQSFSRGLSYYRDGRIFETVLRDPAIEAQCIGSDVYPYRVHATLALHGESDGNPRTVMCTCPRGGFCKHIVALLLSWIHAPERFVVRQPLADQLAHHSHDDLIALIDRMAQRYPDLEMFIELSTPAAQPGSETGSPNEVSVNATTIQRQANAAFALYSPHDWNASYGIAMDLNPLLEYGQSYADSGQWANAQVVFTTLAKELGDWFFVGGAEAEGDLSSILTACVDGLIACLDAQPALAETDRLSEEWRVQLVTALFELWRLDYLIIGGIGFSDPAPEGIARNATDGEREMVQAWLQDEVAEGWLRKSQLNFLATLYKAAGLDDDALLKIYRDGELWDEVTMTLLELERLDEAITTARRYLKDPRQLVTFASALIARGGTHVRQALSLVEDRAWETEGLNPAYDTIYQGWLIAQYSNHDRPQDALAAAQRRFDREPSVWTYQAVRDAARLPQQPPDTWTELRPKLIAHVEAREVWSELVQIHLMDEDIGSALRAYDQWSEQGRTAPGYPLMMGYASQTDRLAQAAERDFPDRAMELHVKQAEQMIANKQRSSYQVAAKHLARVNALLERLDRADEWQTLITDLRERYKKLPALQDELNKLDLH